MHLNSTRRLLVLPLTGSLLVAGIIALHVHLFYSPVPSSIQTYIENLFRGKIASGTPNSDCMPGSFKDLEPGDIVLGGWDNCAYGLYSHAGIYAGNGLVLEALVDTGVTDMHIDHFMQYSHVAVIRIRASSEARQKAVAFVESKRGEIFFPLAYKTDSRYWNCTTVLWKAYLEQGIDLDALGDLWISPENLKYSPEVDIIYDRNR